jgi:hypothetical protein
MPVNRVEVVNKALCWTKEPDAMMAPRSSKEWTAFRVRLRPAIAANVPPEGVDLKTLYRAIMIDGIRAQPPIRWKITLNDLLETVRALGYQVTPQPRSWLTYTPRGDELVNLPA